MGEIPISPVTQKSDAVQEFRAAERHADPTSMERYFHNLPVGSRMLSVVHFRREWQDWIFVAEQPKLRIILIPKLFLTTGTVLALSASIGLSLAAVVILIGQKLIPGVRPPQLVNFLVVLSGMVSMAFLVPTYLISVKFSRYIHDKYVDLEKEYEEYFKSEHPVPEPESATNAPESGAPRT